MNTENIWGGLTNQYSLSKTLRFELKPVGFDGEELVIDESLNSIEKIIEEDKQRNEDFKIVKKIADEYFKEFIERSLKFTKISKTKLEEFENIYLEFIRDKQNKNKRDNFDKLNKELRKNLKELVKLKFKDEFSTFFKKEFYEKVLPLWLDKRNRIEDKKLVEKFKGFTTYFTGFNSNRENVFSENNIPTSIFYRIVDDNLPKYLANYDKFKKILEVSNDKFGELQVELKDELEGLTLLEFLSIQNYNLFLNQSGIEKYNKRIIGKINSRINELIQRDKDLTREQIKILKKSKLQVLFNQILSDKESLFTFDKFNSDYEVLTKIDEFYNNLNSKNQFDEFSNLFENLDSENFDLSLIKIKNGKFISDISQNIFGDYNVIKEDLKREYIKSRNYDIEKLNKKQQEEIEKYLKTDYFCFKEIQNSISRIKETRDDSDEIITLFDFFKDFKFSVEHKSIDLLKNIEDSYKSFNSIKFEEFKNESQKKLTQDKYNEVVNVIKEFLDALQNYYHFVKLLKFENEYRDEHFYQIYDELLNLISQITPLYNKVRNYISQKPFSTQKFKLNFQSSSFLNGWDSNFETKSAVILKKKINNKTNYYIAISPKKIENNENDFSVNKGNFEILNYDFQKPDNKNIPRLFIRSKGDNFSPNVEKYNLPVQEIIEIYDKGYFKTEFRKTNFSKFKESLVKLIDYFKLGFQRHESYKHFKFNWKESREYEDISQFYFDVESSCYQLNFKKINEEYIKQLVEENKLYLFQIYNKDFSQNKIKKENYNSKKNLHTMYFEELFSEENLEDVVFKLNGQAEIFYREKSIEYKPTHPKNLPTKNKDPINGKEESLFSYDIGKNKRYTQDKVLFHVPITLNFKSNSRVRINNEVNKVIKQNSKNINILSLDRGERHLLYYTLLDTKGNIKEKGSFNLINDSFNRKVNYHQKLSKLEKERDEKRKSWQNISTIKELKEGFLSQIIHKISKIAVENNAIIVLEDLNYGFKRGRFKVEKQVYEKFEKMLISKLNFLVFKDKKNDEIGGNLKAYQLTPEVNVLKDIGKQTGILFYIDPYLTSKICPKTAFVNRLYPKYENESQAKDFINKFDSIRYLKDEDLFEFSFKYSSFGVKDLVKDDWKIYSNGIKLVQSRDKNQNNNWTTKSVNVNEELKKLFNDFNIKIEESQNLIDDIVKQNKFFLENIIKNLKLILQLRNSYTDNELKINKITEKEGDYILSCVKNKKGYFFDSRNANKEEVDNADCNGAYHIGLKGLMVLNKIKEFEDIEKIKFNDLKIERNEFLNEMIRRNWS